MDSDTVTSRQPVGPLVNGNLQPTTGPVSNGLSSPASSAATVINSKPQAPHLPSNSDHLKNRELNQSSNSAKHSSSSSTKPSSDKPVNSSSSSKEHHKDKSKSHDPKKDPSRSSGDHHSSSSKDKTSGESKSSSSSGAISSKEKDKSRDSSSKDHKDKHSSSSKSSSSKDSKSSSSKHDHEKKEHSSKSHSSSSDKMKNGEKPKESISIKPSTPSAVNITNDGNKSVLSVSASATPDKAAIPKLVIKMEKGDDSDDDVPLGKRMESLKKAQNFATDIKVKQEKNDPKLATPVKVKKEKEDPIIPKRSLSDESDDEPLSERMAKKAKPSGVKVKEEKGSKRKSSSAVESVSKKQKKGQVEESPVKKEKKVKEEEEETKWRWWEETKTDTSVKWNTLEHKGPLFAPPYDPLPSDVIFRYDGKPMKLSSETEEVATFYGKMLDHEYCSRDVFNSNFFKDWRKVMTEKERSTIVDLKKCDFSEINVYFKQKSEERKAMTKEQKQEIKKANELIQKEYGFCIIDGHKQKIGNFKIEPPGLFRGRGNHPKQGMLKRRVMPEDVSINCSKGVTVSPPQGHKWKDVRHDNTVTWLASWTENVQGQTKYVMLNAASKLKGQKDWQKYETARRLHTQIEQIRETYKEDWKSKEMRIRQRAVALYFIDKLALRAGNEKDEDQADTVGCCSLRVEHIKLHEEYEGQEFVVEFDFLGKDSIRYYNRIPVEKRVFKNLQLFMENKQEGDDLFDRLNTMILNKHLQSLMDGLTAKVFRTYNASVTLQKQLDLLTVPDDAVAAKILAYNRANRAVAILCNHQRAAPKNFDQQMSKIQEKIDAKVAVVKAAKKELKAAKADYKHSKNEKNKKLYEQKKKAYQRLQDQLNNLKVQQTDRDENKEIALGTSKLNYLDPRISVAWCKKWGIPIEKIYNKTQRDKFAWAIDMAESSYKFTEPGEGGPVPENGEDEEEEEDDE